MGPSNEPRCRKLNCLFPHTVVKGSMALFSTPKFGGVFVRGHDKPTLTSFLVVYIKYIIYFHPDIFGCEFSRTSWIFPVFWGAH